MTVNSSATATWGTSALTPRAAAKSQVCTVSSQGAGWEVALQGHRPERSAHHGGGRSGPDQLWYANHQCAQRGHRVRAERGASVASAMGYCGGVGQGAGDSDSDGDGDSQVYATASSSSTGPEPSRSR